MGETKSTDYIPENANEEYALLVGRLKAFEAWANSVNDYDFTKKMAFRMLGLIQQMKLSKLQMQITRFLIWKKQLKTILKRMQIQKHFPL